MYRHLPQGLLTERDKGGGFYFIHMLMNEAICQFSKYREFQGKGKTVHGYGLMLRQFCLHLRNPRIEDIKIDHIIEYFQGMLLLGWDRNSFIPRCVAIRKFLEFFRKQNYDVLHEELVPIPSKEYKMPRVMTEETYYALIGAIPEETNDPRYIRNAALLRMYWDTVSRNSEVLSLDLPVLEMDKCRAPIITKKNKGSRPARFIFWKEETHKYLVRWLEKRAALYAHSPFKDAQAVFVGIGSNQYGKRLSIRGTGEITRRLALRAGLPIGTAVNLHSMRHRGCREIIRRGGSSADVMNIAGHATIQSTTPYTMMFGDDLQDRWDTIFNAKPLLVQQNVIV